MEGRQTRFIGVDCGGDSHVAVLLDDEGRFDRRIEMVHRRDSIEDGLAELLLRVGDDVDVAVVVESRRSYGRMVSDVAMELGCDIRQVGTVALSHYRAIEGQPRKNDQWDAFLGARMGYLKAQGIRAAPEMSGEERALSRLTRTHRRLKRERTRRDAQLAAVLLELAPEVLHSDWQGPKPTSKAMLYLLQRWPGFEGLERAHLASIEKILRRCRYGDRATKIAELIRQIAKRIWISGPERRAIGFETALLVREVLSLDEELKEIGREISVLVEEHPVGKKLLKVPSIGPLTAGILVSELLPIARQATEAQSATYAGVTPLGRQSGKSLNRARLTQGVNKRVLAALYETSVNAVKTDPISRRYFQKKLKDYAGHPKPTVAAYIALSRQRHRLIYKLMTTDAQYDRDILLSRHFERIDAQREKASSCGN